MHAELLLKRGARTLAAGLIVGLGLFLAASDGIAQPSLKAVLRTGQQVQDASGTIILGVTISSISGASASLGPEGHVISEVTLAGTGVGTSNDLAVVVARFGETPILVVREGDTLAGGGLPSGVTFVRPATGDSISSLLVGPAGVVAFKATVNGLASGTSVILAGPAANVSAVAFVGQAVSGDFGVNYLVTAFSAPRLNNAGTLAFHTRTRNPTNGSLLAEIIWTGPPPNMSAALRTGVNYPGLTATNSTFEKFTLDGLLFNDGGMVLVQGTERYQIGVTDFTVNGFWLKAGNSVHLIAQSGTPLSGFPGVTNGSPRPHPVTMSLANDGTVSFQSGLFGVGVTNGNDEAIFAGEFSGTNVITDLIARRGDPAPDESGAPLLPPFRWFGIFAPVGAAPGGVTVLRAEIVSGNTTNDFGVWLWDGAILKLFAREGDPVRGMPTNRWTFLPQVCLSPAGQIGIWATLLANETAVLVYDAQGQFQGAIRKNDLVDMGNGTTNQVSSVQGLSNTSKLLNGSDGLGMQFNASGQLLVRLSAPATILALYQSAPGGSGQGAISGQVRRDLDADGDFNDTDPGYPNVTLELFRDDGTGNPMGAALRSLRPAANGTYSFTNVAGGGYLVKATVDANEINNNGIAIRAPADGHRAVAVSGTQSVTNAHFLVARFVTISGRVLNDADGNDRISEFDEGLAGVKVELFTDPEGDGVVNDLISPGGTMFTDSAGKYTLALFDVGQGRYVVRETNPPGYESVGDAAGGNDDLIPILLSSGPASVTNHFLDRPEGWVRITLHRVTVTAVDLAETSRAGPLHVIGNAAILSQQPPVSRGMVADFVTPLIIRFHAEVPSLHGVPLTLSLSGRLGALVPGQGGELKMLRGNQWGDVGSFDIANAAADIFMQIRPVHFSRLQFQSSAPG